MFNLIVAAEEDVWSGRRYGMPMARFCEYTAEGFKARYMKLDQAAVDELLSFPTLFAYEDPVGADAHVGRITRIRRSARGDVRFDFELDPSLPPISPDQMGDISWDLDLGSWEMNRTHWAIKDVDLFGVLEDAGLGSPSGGASIPENRASARATLYVSPTVFSVPELDPEEDLVALMMPFGAAFDPVAEAVRAACASAGLRCQRADDIWDEATIIQDVFNLIFRSRLVVVDLSNQNGNVLYETGIAHTLGRPVVPISQNMDSVPFDLSHHRTLVYLRNSEGLGELESRLARKLGSLTA